LYIIFGGLAIIVTGVTLDPLALRHRLSPGLPFSDVFFQSYSKAFSMFFSLHFSHSPIAAL
jgi:hypothetical protein